MRFLGNIEAKLDSKGRVFLPASFRKSFSNDAAIKLVCAKMCFKIVWFYIPKTCGTT